ncbi:ABC transporter permease [bacterium]|nr:ABC transporter permease [candidate division CSSED10-310 bacterium]
MIEIVRQEMRATVRSVAFIIFLLVLFLMAYGLTSGNIRLASGSSDIGGTKTCMTSEFSIAFIISLLSFVIYSFFVTIPSGMTLIRDRECRMEEILHTTSLRPSEYIFGKFLAVLTVFIGAMFLQCFMFMVVHHGIPGVAEADVIGPFNALNYLRPFILFCIPTIIFFAGVAFAIGEWTRRPVLVYLFPTLILIFDVLFFVNWSPEWLPDFWNNVLILMDQSGFRWLDETWLTVDKGAAFYNTEPIRYNMLFAMNRLLAVAAGIIPVVLSYRHFARRLRMTDTVSPDKHHAETLLPIPSAPPDPFVPTSPSIPSTPSVSLAPPVKESDVRRESPVTQGVRTMPGFGLSLNHVLRSELQELRNQAGLYLFIPVFTLIVLGDVFTSLGIFETPMLVTSGSIAVSSLRPLTILGVLLLMFYVVEAFKREETTGMEAILNSSPVSTHAIVIGKLTAVLAVGLVIMAASFISAILGLVIQGSVPVDPFPFLLVWGIVLLPTYLVWIAFIAFLYSLVRNRYVTYAAGLGIFMLFGMFQLRGDIHWVSNWVMWRSIHWSDISILEVDRLAVVLNRLLYMAVAVLCMALAAALTQRMQRDPARTLYGLRPMRLLRNHPGIGVLILIPLVLGWVLYGQVRSGHGGREYEKATRDYWRHNVQTYRDYPEPGLTHVALQVAIDPGEGRLRTTGQYELINPHNEELRALVFTGDYGWEDVTWTLAGEAIEPENRSGLFVIDLQPPLRPNEGISLAFSLTNTVPKGISRNGDSAMEFILPSGVVLTSFSPSFAPLPGYQPDVGVDEDNQSNAREYEPDFHVGRTLPLFGAANAFTTHIEVTVPARMRANSVGVLTDVVDHGDTRTWIWDSDYPLRFYNIVAGEYAVQEGNGTAVYFHPGHAYNIDCILQALNGAREHYSDWYAPYPWKELRITEFPGIAYYAQGFPSNISFSEQVGFLVKEEEEGNAAFTVAAHESAHQWWANILTPGKGPGGNVLSEGMAHFSTAMLIDVELGVAAREAFMKRIEDSYGNKRMVDNERALARVDGSRPGDDTVMYDKGGWVFWMLRDRMGHEAFMTGLQAFIAAYRFGPDYPVIQDFTAFMRPYAPDPSLFDTFVDRWFYDVVVPEYRLEGVVMQRFDPVDDAGGLAGDMPETGRGVVPVPVMEGAPETAMEVGSEAVMETVPGESEWWRVTGVLRNVGSGTVDVLVAACMGRKYPDADGGEAVPDEAVSYRSRCVRVAPGPGDSVPFEIQCSFRPDRVEVDPDVMVLQLNRKFARIDHPVEK